MDTAHTSPSACRFSSASLAMVCDLGLEAFQIWAALLSTLCWVGICSAAALFSGSAQAQSATAALADAGVLQAHVQALMHQQSVSNNQGLRVEVSLGQLDPRLKLAPCDKVKAYMPEGARLWGNTRVGLRCEQGPVRWNVFWPVTVKVWGKALVATVPLHQGMQISEADLRLAEVDLASHASPALVRIQDALGRTMMRNIEPGQGLRQDDLRVRRWFAAGDPVRLVVRGAGFAVASEGTALTNGDEGQCAKVRLDGGRIVCGDPVGQRQVEILL